MSPILTNLLSVNGSHLSMAARRQDGGISLRQTSPSEGGDDHGESNLRGWLDLRDRGEWSVSRVQTRRSIRPDSDELAGTPACFALLRGFAAVHADPGGAGLHRGMSGAASPACGPMSRASQAADWA